MSRLNLHMDQVSIGVQLKMDGSCIATFSDGFEIQWKGKIFPMSR